MIERQGGSIHFVCDECPDVFETDTEDFSPAWASAKQAGWRSFKIGTEWCHACPACVEKFSERQK
jgi:hypothetical protein